MNQYDVQMTGYEMEPQKMTVTLSRHALNLMQEHHASKNSEAELMHIAFLLAEKSIADYVLNEVCIGECAIIVDEGSGCAYSVRMLTSEIIVQTVYYKKASANWMNAGKDAFLSLFKNVDVKIAPIFSDESTMVAAF